MGYETWATAADIPILSDDELAELMGYTKGLPQFEIPDSVLPICVEGALRRLGEGIKAIPEITAIDRIVDGYNWRLGIYCREEDKEVVGAALDDLCRAMKTEARHGV